MILYALQQSSRQDRLFSNFNDAKETAELLIDKNSDEYKIYLPDVKYYFYARNISIHGHIKILKTQVEK